jgi:predicted phosphodiesterase
MLAALISDTHGYLPAIPPNADLVLHAGDIGIDGTLAEQARWFTETWLPWARALDRPVFAIWGNHDFIGEQWHRDGLPGMPAHVDVVTDELRVIGGVPVWFSPWSSWFGDWAWMRHEAGLAERYALIPPATQVIVTHGPPRGAGDRVWDGREAGSTSLARRIGQLAALRLVVTGHIHEARGVGRCHGVEVWNVSCVDLAYRPVRDPVVLVPWPPRS